MSDSDSVSDSCQLPVRYYLNDAVLWGFLRSVIKEQLKQYFLKDYCKKTQKDHISKNMLLACLLCGVL